MMKVTMMAMSSRRLRIREGPERFFSSLLVAPPSECRGPSLNDKNDGWDSAHADADAD